mmetsp:Transcript_1598/g.3663  ORF Transcript_1598/g.3663 Transcript_1598/m.3663 type:complete len:605 (+) Transcript_1598:192-2006(+)
MVYKLCDKFAKGGYGTPLKGREAIAAASRVVIDIGEKATGLRANGQISISYAATILEQVHALCAAGKTVVVVHSGQQGAKQSLEAIAKQLSLEGVEMCVTAGDLSSEATAKPVGQTIGELLGKTSFLVVQGPAGLSPQIAKAASAELLIMVAAGGTISEEARAGADSLQQSGTPVVVVDDAVADGILQVAAGQGAGTLIAAPAAAADGSAGGAKAADARATAIAARNASRQLQALPTSSRQAVLERVAKALEAAEEEIMAANAKDVELGEKAGIDAALMQRLKLKPEKIKQLAVGVRAIAQQEEPIRKPLSAMEIADGLVLERVTAPIGVCLIIFEARPDALPQIASLAIRSGNGLLLKGGKEATNSNACLHRIITQALAPDVDAALINLVTTREGVDQLLALDDVIDLVIPRGSNSLVRYIQTHTKIPVLGHADGICHVYVDPSADMQKARSICIDSKVDYPAACNALEKILVHKDLASDGRLDQLVSALQAENITVHRGDVCPATATALSSSLPLAPSPRHEYGSLDLTIEVRLLSRRTEPRFWDPSSTLQRIFEVGIALLRGGLSTGTKQCCAVQTPHGNNPAWLIVLVMKHLRSLEFRPC